MQKRMIALWLLLLPAAAGWSQEQPAAPETPGTEAETATVDEPDVGTDVQDDEPLEESDLDSQTYEEDDDDFVPTEEIPADEPIPFPSNI